MTLIDPAVWTRLLGVRPSGELLTARRAAPETAERFLAAVDASGRRHFLIQLLPDDGTLEDFESRGVTVTTREMQPPQHSLAKYLDIVCLDGGGHAVFDLIGEEIVSELAAGQKSAPDVVARVLAKWRRFWSQAPRRCLTRAEQMGLFAELWFLARWLLPAAGASESVRRWRGPFSSRHDFEWVGTSVEAKASGVVRAPVFRITGLDQLDPPSEGSLFLFGIHVREEAGATVTLPSMVAETLALFETHAEALGRLEAALVQIGYSPLDEAEYRTVSWRLIAERLYPITGRFPKLTPGSLRDEVPPGISEVSYSLDLGAYAGTAYSNPESAAHILR